MSNNAHFHDHHLFEVKLLVALPNYYCGEHQPEATALDAIFSALHGSDITILGCAEQQMSLIPKGESK